MRLDKFLSNKGYGSRREVKGYIKRGFVKVNDEVIKDESTSILETDTVSLKDEVINNIPFTYYIMLNKPQGYVSATTDRDACVVDLINTNDKDNNIFPVGRLDKDTTGLLLLTNDGDFAHKTLSPKKHVPKKYFVEIDGTLNDEHIKMFEDGLVLSDITCKPSTLEITDVNEDDNISKCFVTISEGKFHQIKRMFHKIGCDVLSLKRVSFGAITLDDSLQEGEYRFLNEEELLFVKSVKEPK